MREFEVREVTYPTEYPHRRLHANNYYEDYIIEHWPREESAVLMVWLRERTDIGWKALGELLTRDLLTLGPAAGLSFNGDYYAAGQLAQFAQSAWRDSDDQSQCALAMDRRPHPQFPDRPERMTVETTWSSLHRTTDVSWLPSLWAHTESDWFDYGCLLLLTVYSTGAVSQKIEDDGLNMETFGLTLADAVGWLTPVDGNVGFSIGIPRRSAMYEHLINGTSP